MRLAFAEVFETATFYAHFDVVKEGGRAIPALTVRVCDSLTCAMFGAERLLATLQQELGPGVRVVRAPCVGLCDDAPAVEVGHNFLKRANVASVKAAVAHGDTHPHVPDYIDYDAYRAAGGYQTLERLRSGALSVEDVLKVLDDGALRGLGGAGFPTGRKWRSVRGEPGPRLMAVNGDEGEPGTFKDQYYLNTDPHRFLEGMLIGAHVVEARGRLHLHPRRVPDRAADPRQRDREAARRAARRCICGAGRGPISAARSPRSIESIEGKRGLPRHKPPFPFQVGLFGRPTLINNVETLFWVRDLIERGADWWKSHGRNGRFGLRSFSVSGRVKDPGVKLAPAGVTIQELIDEFCGGMSEGHTFAAYLPGRRLGRHPAGVHERHPARFRHAREVRLLHRLGGGHRAVRPGRRARRGAQPHALLRGRVLRPVHAVPRRHAEGAHADGAGRVGHRAARRAVAVHARRLHLRPGPGGRPIR